jgi:hypothetical protein
VVHQDRCVPTHRVASPRRGGRGDRPMIRLRRWIRRQHCPGSCSSGGRQRNGTGHRDRRRNGDP